jgi:hypothetical protein
MAGVVPIFGKFFRSSVVIVGIIAAMTSPLAAKSSSNSQHHAIGIQGTVPLSCRVSVDGELTSGSTAVLREFCNNSAGYQVVAEHSAALAGAKLVVDGDAVTLSERSTVVSRSAAARIATRQISLQLPTGAEAGAISFRIVAP